MRNILADKPRVTRYQIDWSNQQEMPADAAMEGAAVSNCANGYVAQPGLENYSQPAPPVGDENMQNYMQT